MPGRGRLIAYTASTALAALVVAGWAVPQVGWREVLVAIVAVFVAEYFSTTFRDDVHVSLSNIVVLVAVIVHAGPALAVLSTLGATGAIALRATDMRVVRTVFNGGQLMLSAAAAGAAYSWAIDFAGASFPDPMALLLVLVASSAYSVVNHGLVAGAIALTSTERFLPTFLSVGPSVAMQVPYVGIAVLAAVILLASSPWALVLMAVPALVARHGLLAFQALDRSYDQMVRVFVQAIEMKDLYTRGHSERVEQLSILVAEELKLPYEERRLTGYAALLHDVGKVGVPLCIINKPGPLDDDEFAEIKKHPTIGAEILDDIDFLGRAIDIVRYHHERLDGRGYPHGVGADELSVQVRIVTAVDAFDAMTSTRSYRRALPVADAITELRRCAGGQFDPDVVEALARVVSRVDWKPTIEFASEAELNGEDIPLGSFQERVADAARELPG